MTKILASSFMGFVAGAVTYLVTKDFNLSYATTVIIAATKEWNNE